MTRLTPARCHGQLRLRDALQRLGMTLMLVMLTAMTAWAQDAIGSIQYNSIAGYYEIGSVDNLNDLAVYVNGTGTYSTGGSETTAHECNGLTFKMTDDIAYTHADNETDDYAENYTAIGCYSAGEHYFCGNFNGDGHTVSGIRIRKTGTDNADSNQGLFGQIGWNANVHNVRVTDARIKGNWQVGGIVGYQTDDNVVSNCIVTESAITANMFYGTICGYNGGDLTNNYYRGCTVNGTAVTSGKGVGTSGGGKDITENDGVVPVPSGSYIITYKLNGGTNAADNPIIYASATGVASLGDPKRTNYIFEGWYDNASLSGSPITSIPAGTTGDVTLYAKWKAAGFIINSDGNTFTIDSAVGWDIFCDMLDDFVHTDDNGYCFDGKTVKLGADITITRAAGNTGYHDFTGTFDGQGHTLNVNITDTENQGTAPFRVISNATIRNLHVTGTVTGTAHASGLVGKACAGTMLIENCLVEANVSSLVGDTNGNKHCGGVVGHGFGNNSTTANTASLTLRNVVYAGTITCDQHYIGGLQGWSDGNTLTLENCLFAGSYAGKDGNTAMFHPIALRNKNKVTNLTATNVFTAVIPTVTDAQYIACSGAKVTGRTTAPAGLGDEVATYDYMNTTVYEHGLLYNGLYYVAPTFSTDDSGAYLLSNMDDWTNFCDALYDNDTWNRFSGKTLKLTASIGTTEAPVTRVVGSSYHDFCGTFDGQGNTITVSLSSSGESTALFSYVSNTKANPDDANDSPATICKLKVAGTVNVSEDTSHKYAGGLVGSCWGVLNIEDCRISTVIDSHIDGDGTHGGIVGRLASGTLTITGCVFDGQLLGSTTNACSGIVGYRNGGAADIYNTLFAPTALTMSAENSATFIRNATSSCHEGCYYTTAFGATTTSENAQGKAVRTVEAGENVTIDAIALTGDETEYDVSGITAYAGGGLKRTVNDETTLYYGSGDQVSLTLSNTATGAPAGYQYGGYSVSAGTIDGTTLTMPDENVTVSVDTNGALRSTGEPVSVAYVNADGTTAQASAIALDGTETELGQSGQETWYFVGTSISRNGQIDCWGDVNIILPDGKTMTANGGDNSAFKGYRLTIYGQTLGTGTLDASSTGSSVISSNNVNISSGTVNISGGSGGYCIYCGSVNIGGGNVTLTGSKGILCDNTIISGGVVDVTVDEYGITGPTTLSWTNASDCIKVSSYKGEVKIAAGKPFRYTDNNNIRHILGGDSETILKAKDVAAIAGKTLQPVIPIAYINENGSEQICNDYTLLTGNEPLQFGSVFLNDGWYVVASDVEFSKAIQIQGQANIILCDGKTLTINEFGIGSTSDLTIYGQSEQSGILNAANSTNPALQASGTLTINGGNVSGNGVIGIRASQVIINRGTFNYNASHTGISVTGGDLTINGGQVTAIGGNTGIYVGSAGTITLGWTNADDFIKASNYEGTVTLAKAFIDEDGNTYQIGAVDPTAIAGKTLHPYATLAGDANGDGQVTITDAVAVVNYILGNPSADFNKVAANVNGDFDEHGEPVISITDAVGIVNIILNSAE